MTNLQNTMEIYRNDAPVGHITWQKSGMTYLLTAVLTKPPKELCCLYLIDGDKALRLGIPAPSGVVWGLKKRLSATALRTAGMDLTSCETAVLCPVGEDPLPKPTPAAEPIPIPVPEPEPIPESTPEPIPGSEPTPEPISELTPWEPVENVGDVLGDPVLLPLLKDKTTLVGRKNGTYRQIALPYDILDEIYFTPAFCLMEVVPVENDTYFALTLDEKGWPIPPMSRGGKS